MFNDGNVNPGRLKAPTVMLAGVVAAGMFNDGNVNPGRLKAPTVMLAGVVAAGMFNDGNVNPGRLKAPTVMLAGDRQTAERLGWGRSGVGGWTRAMRVQPRPPTPDTTPDRGAGKAGRRSSDCGTIRVGSFRGRWLDPRHAGPATAADAGTKPACRRRPTSRPPTGGAGRHRRTGHAVDTHRQDRKTTMAKGLRTKPACRRRPTSRPPTGGAGRHRRTGHAVDTHRQPCPARSRW